MRPFLIVALIVLLGGCARKAPTHAHYKPVSAWVGALHDPDAAVRHQAVVVLGNVGPVDPAVLPALIEMVHDSDPKVRREAILALLKYGPAAHEAVPALAEAQQDSDPMVRAYAARAVQRIQDGK